MTHMASKDFQIDLKILLMIIAAEALLFYNFYNREIASYPAQYFDQTAYLAQSYSIQEKVHAHGLGEIWSALRRKDHHNGLLFPVEGALAGLVLAGTRLPQLCVLFIAYGALQIVAFATARTVWRSRLYGYLIVGLILSQITLWLWAGGLFDFRIDFFAYSLYGIWACAVIRSNLFLDRRWTIACGLISTFLVLNRFLSVIYIVGVSAGFAATCAIIWFLQRKDADLSGRLRQRLCHVSLSLGILVVVVGPILIINWSSIYAYYVYAQFYYEKDMRARELGLTGLGEHLLYYPTSILKDHLGATFIVASAVSLGGAAAARLLSGTQNLPSLKALLRAETFLLEIIFLLGAILGPVVVLTIDISKSPIIGGIVGVPVALLVGSLVARLKPSPQVSRIPTAHNLITASVVTVLALGLFNQFSHAIKDNPEYARRRDLGRLQELNRWLVNYASDNGWRKPKISFDVVSSELNSGTIVTGGYEQSHQLIEFQTMLGTQVMGVPRAEALGLLAKSDIVILTNQPKVGIYPFYAEIAQYWGDLKSWAETNMVAARTVTLDTFTATVYVRPSVAVSGISGEWISSNGLSIQALRLALLKFPIIHLAGAANYTWLQRTPTVSATIRSDLSEQEVSAILNRVGDRYDILINTSSIQLPPSEMVQIKIEFDTFFVPKQIGLNSDVRELVVQAPDLIELIRPPS